MTQSEHAEIVRRATEGTISLGIDRPFARKFYTDVPLRVIEEQTGEAPYLEKTFAYACFLGSPTALVASAYFTITTFGWWGVLAIPASIVVWLFYASCSAVGTSTLRGISVAIVILLALYLLLPEQRMIISVVLPFGLALWLNRLLYVGATAFLRNFIVRNHRAYVFVQDHITLRGT
ncbi:MAG: hypothetical protein ABMA26_20290 [Limisphaerales bacterium]